MYGLFTEAEMERISIEFGYEEWDRIDETLIISLSAIVSIERKNKIIALLDEVDQIETLVTDTLKKGFIQAVDTVQLSYTKSANRLMAEASRKLEWAAYLCHVQLKYNRFSENTGLSPSKLAFY